MSGFLDSCKQSSEILIPFIFDTMVSGNVRPEETSVLMILKASSSRFGPPFFQGVSEIYLLLSKGGNSINYKL